MKHYIGETGSQLIFDCGVILGSADFQYIKYRKPDGTTTGTWTASLYSSYSQIAQATGTYFISKTLASTDFDTPGEWRFQAFIGAIDGTWFGETVKLNVYDSFE